MHFLKSLVSRASSISTKIPQAQPSSQQRLSPSSHLIQSSPPRHLDTHPSFLVWLTRLPRQHRHLALLALLRAITLFPLDRPFPPSLRRLKARSSASAETLASKPFSTTSPSLSCFSEHGDHFQGPVDAHPSPENTTRDGYGQTFGIGMTEHGDRLTFKLSVKKCTREVLWMLARVHELAWTVVPSTMYWNFICNVWNAIIRKAGCDTSFKSRRTVSAPGTFAWHSGSLGIYFSLLLLGW